MDVIQRRLEKMNKRIDEFGGALQDIQVEQRALTRQSERVETSINRLADTFDLFKISINDVFEGLLQHDSDHVRWRHAIEDRLSDIEKKLAG